MSTYYVAGLPYSDELYHFGIKGQKWGIRRYQNPDGTLTPAGKERYGTDTQQKKQKNTASSPKKKAKDEKRAYRRKLIKDASNVHKMSDKELLEKIGRLEKEQKLMNLTYERLTSSGDPAKNTMIQAGKRIVGAALAGLGAYTGAAILTGEFNPKTLASYMFSNPNKKK